MVLVRAVIGEEIDRISCGLTTAPIGREWILAPSQLDNMQKEIDVISSQIRSRSVWAMRVSLRQAHEQ